MKTRENAFKTMEELNKFLTLNVLYQLKLDLKAQSIDISVSADEVSLIVKTKATITEMPKIINTCSCWFAYAYDDYLVFEFVFILDE